MKTVASRQTATRSAAKHPTDKAGRFRIWIRRSTLALAALILLPLQLAAQTVPVSGLVAYYPFDGNANDASGNGHHGSTHGTISAPGRLENPAGACWFDGIDDYIEVAYSEDFSLTTWTIAGWFNADTVAASRWLVAKEANSNDKYNYAVCFATTGRLSSSYETCSEEPGNLASGTVAPGKWCFFAAVRDHATKENRLYVNGTLSGLAVYNNTPCTASTRLLFGVGPSGPLPLRDYFKGRLDDVRIYNRVLTPQEVQELSNMVPLINAIKVTPQHGTSRLNIDYDLYSPAPCNIAVAASSDGGATWSVPMSSARGALGVNVAPGLKKRVVWDVGADWPNQFTTKMVVCISTTGVSAESSPFRVDTRDGSWLVRAYADKDGDRQFDPGEEVAAAEVYYGGRTDNPFKLKEQTGPDGTLRIAKAAKRGTPIFIRGRIHEEAAKKAPITPGTDRRMFSLWLDSDRGASDTLPSDGTWNPYVLDAADEGWAYGGGTVDIRLAHPVFEWDLVVATAVKDGDFHRKLRKGFEDASQYLFDVTDGQMKLGDIAIYANVEQNSDTWNRADMVVRDDGEYRPNADVNGVQDAGETHMFFGTSWLGDNPDGSDYWRSIVHEFGHYALDFWDEYIDGNGSEALWDSYRSQHHDEVPGNYGLMDNEHDATEMSSYNDYLMAYFQGTDPATITDEIFRHSLNENAAFFPCWAWLESEWEKKLYKETNIPIDVVAPPSGYYEGYERRSSEDRSGPEHIPAPYSKCAFPMTGSGDQAALMAGRNVTGVGAIAIQVTADEVPVSGALVTRHPRGEENVRVLGLTDKRGELSAYDIAAEDVLMARCQGQEGLMVVPADPAVPMQIAIDGLSTRGVRLMTSGPNEGLGILVWARVVSVPSCILGLELAASVPLVAAPAVIIYPSDSRRAAMGMTAESPDRYSGALDLVDAVGGTVDLSCEAGGTVRLASTDQFALVKVSPSEYEEAHSRDGWLDLHLPAGSTITNAVALIYTSYAPPIMPSGFAKVKIGPVQSLSLGGDTNLHGHLAVVNIHYREIDLIGVDETTIQLHRWNEAARAWDVVASGVSVDGDVVSASLASLGIFALFAEPSQDVTPPGRISDLTASTGANGWSVNLRWTATGDDDAMGTATTYILTFNRTEITGTNWDACATMPVGFGPHSAGTIENAGLQMPDPGVTYFFTIRAQDEAGNLGPMSNVTMARSHQLDTDGDGLMDQWEVTYGLNPTDGADVDLDADADGVTNRQEYDLGTNPAAWDSDGDGMADAWELEHGLNPRSSDDGQSDPDEDGLSNWDEYWVGNNPVVFDNWRFGWVRVGENGGLELTVIGKPGGSGMLETSTDLVSWVKKEDFVSAGTNTFTIPASLLVSRQFFRVAVQE